MRITLSNETVSALEEISGKQITRNGEQVIREIVQIVENKRKKFQKQQDQKRDQEGET